jgi:hypothetical protein
VSNREARTGNQEQEAENRQQGTRNKTGMR